MLCQALALPQSQLAGLGVGFGEQRFQLKGTNNVTRGTTKRAVFSIRADQRASVSREDDSHHSISVPNGGSARFDLSKVMREWRNAAVPAVAGATIALCLAVHPAGAVDALKTCACLLQECRGELFECLEDPKCAANVACLNTCNNRPDETECQIKCGDLFENSKVDKFNKCAVTDKRCVAQKPDDGKFRIPPQEALVTEFDAAKFTGKWYISSGLNRTFDTFDCQLHDFAGEPGKFVGKLTWRIETPDGGFFTRSAEQRFVQDPQQPGIFYNHDNEYILSSKIDNTPDDYVLVYYRGSNDAWDGYGGGFLYTRAKTVPEKIVPELDSSLRKIGLSYGQFTPTDNTCGPLPPLFQRLGKKVEEVEKAVVKEISKDEEAFLRELTKDEQALVQEFARDEEKLLANLEEGEKAILSRLSMGAQDIEKLFNNPLAIRKSR
eukprot:jgi/Mesen1/2907/ME000175S02063